jgi:uncharacterized protein
MTAVAKLGRGWRYPVLPRDGELAIEEGPEKVRQSIWLILDTEKGERIMRPGFGCGLRRYLMKPNTTATRALIQYDVEQALATWEPRIALSSVSVDPDPAEPSLVLVQIDYAHVRDGKPGNLVYPFYLE